MNKMAMAAIGIGAAYLLRNKESRNQLMKQMGSLTAMGGLFGGSTTQKNA